MHIATLAVGIGDYIHADYRDDGRRLRFAAQDAEHFHNYARKLWPHSLHILLQDGAATLDEIIRRSAEIVQIKPDQLIVYISGHGEEPVSGIGWFCAADARRGHQSLTANALDQILETVRARETLLIVDCCFAEGVVIGSKFFGTLAGADVRLFMASARANQLAWEDDELEQSVFSRFLMRALTAPSPCAANKDRISVEAELFPYLHEQVAFHVFETKAGNKQESIKGGISVDGLELPLAEGSFLARERSIVGVLHRQRWRILAGLTVLFATAFILVNSFLYYMAPSSHGSIQVRYGLRAFSIPASEIIPPRVDSAVSVSDLSTTDAVGIHWLEEGRQWGIWPQKDATGLRRWWSDLVPFLKEDSRLRFQLRLFGTLPPRFLDKQDALADSSRIQVLADAATLDKQDADLAAEHLFEALPGPATVDCLADRPATMDFTIYQLPHGEVTGYFRALSFFVQSVPKRSAEGLNRAMAIVAHRLLKPPDEIEALEEYESFQEFLDSLPTGSGAWLRDPNLIVHSKTGWCRTIALSVLASLGQGTAATLAQQALARVAAQYRPEQDGDAPSFQAAVAFAALSGSARHHALEPALVASFVAPLAADSRGASGYASLGNWAGDVAQWQRLPDGFLNFLFRELHSKESGNRIAALSLLARNASFLTLDERKRGWAAVSQAMIEEQGTSDLDQILGEFGCADSTSDIAISYLVGRLHPEIVTDNSTRSQQGYFTVRATDFEAGLALAKIASKNRISDHQLGKLEKFVAARSEMPNARVLYQGLSAQRMIRGKSGVQNLARAISERLHSASNDGRERLLEAEVGLQLMLANFPLGTEQGWDQLREEWSGEAEPEVRADLGLILLGSVQGSFATSACDPRSH